MQFNYGFEYLGVRYGWKNKNLYRLPFTRNLRSFGLKEIKPLVIGSTTVYNVQRNKLTIKKLEKMTQKTDWKIEVLMENTCPF